ncbi:MAG: M24 family metallopeptidase [Actinobacteria bacterium]|nr:M24 family metallopeptidase [Actinomycetota bacterium]
MRRRHEALAQVMTERGTGACLVYGAERAGSGIAWLTGWPVTREAALLLVPGERHVMFVCFNNHVPNARRMAPFADVRPGCGSALTAALELLAARSSRPSRLGVIGPVPARSWGALGNAAAEIEFLDRDYTRLRLVKSEEEISWLRTGARMTDDAVAALREAARPGVTEAECCAAIEAAYLPAGGLNHIHYLCATPMSHPQTCVPSQWPTNYRLAAGDVLTCEVSASYGGYPGQLLRTFAVDGEPPPLYEDLHATAEAAFTAMAARLRPGATAADLLDAASVITRSGYTVFDDLVHGFGGGYLPPVISRSAVESGDVEDFTFAAGMTAVLQPNVITPDERAGVQTGELMLITRQGCESLHSFPRGFGRTGMIKDLPSAPRGIA